MSRKPQEDIEILLHDVLPFAKQMLGEHSEFFPYGGYLRQNASIVHVGARERGNEQPKSSSLIQILQDELRELTRRGAIRASAIVFDVRIIPPNETETTDAIQVNLEHQDSYCAEVFFPYRITNGAIEFGETFAQGGQPIVFS